MKSEKCRNVAFRIKSSSSSNPLSSYPPQKQGRRPRRRLMHACSSIFSIGRYYYLPLLHYYSTVRTSTLDISWLVLARARVGDRPLDSLARQHEVLRRRVEAGLQDGVRLVAGPSPQITLSIVVLRGIDAVDRLTE